MPPPAKDGAALLRPLLSHATLAQTLLADAAAAMMSRGPASAAAHADEVLPARNALAALARNLLADLQNVVSNREKELLVAQLEAWESTGEQLAAVARVCEDGYEGAAEAAAAVAALFPIATVAPCVSAAAWVGTEGVGAVADGFGRMRGPVRWLVAGSGVRWFGKGSCVVNPVSVSARDEEGDALALHASDVSLRMGPLAALASSSADHSGAVTLTYTVPKDTLGGLHLGVYACGSLVHEGKVHEGSFPTKSLRGNRGIAVFPDDSLLAVVNVTSQTLTVYGLPGGGLVRSLKLRRPSGVCFTPQDTLLVAESWHDCLWEVSVTGARLRSLPLAQHLPERACITSVATNGAVVVLGLTCANFNVSVYTYDTFKPLAHFGVSGPGPRGIRCWLRGGVPRQRPRDCGGHQRVPRVKMDARRCVCQRRGRRQRGHPHWCYICSGWRHHLE